MFTNLHSIHGLSNDDYRQRLGISNTELGNLADQLMGRLRDPSPRAFRFGQLFHAAILEPEAFDVEAAAASSDEDLDQCSKALQLSRVIRRQRYSRHVLYLGTPELSHFATHEETGLLVKVRPDLLIDSPTKRRRTVVDFKTTSAHNENRFLETVLEYGYDRQAAFYCDVLGAHRFVIIGVQKRSPYRSWKVEIVQGGELMTLGRKKYRRLLRELDQRGEGAKLVTADYPFEGHEKEVWHNGQWVPARRVGLNTFEAGPLGIITADAYRQPLAVALSTLGSATVTLEAA